MEGIKMWIFAVLITIVLWAVVVVTAYEIVVFIGDDPAPTTINQTTKGKNNIEVIEGPPIDLDSLYYSDLTEDQDGKNYIFCNKAGFVVLIVEYSSDTDTYRTTFWKAEGGAAK